MKKKSRKRQRSTEKDPKRVARRGEHKGRASDVIQGPGFQMVRQGRFIHTQVSRTQEEHRELVEAFAGSETEQHKALVRQAHEIEAELRKFDTFTVLSSLSLLNHLVDPETYQEVSHPGKSIVVEYASLLALKSPYSDGEQLYPSGETIGRLQQQIDDAIMAGIWLQMARDARLMLADAEQTGAPTPSPSPLGEMQMAMRLHELGVRNPAYSHHHRALLRELFAPFNEILLRLLGFTIDNAIDLAEAVPARLTRLSQEKLDKARTSARELEQEVEQARRGPARDALLALTTSESDEERKHADFILGLAKKSPNKVRRYASFAMVEWVLFVASDICTFTADALGAEANVPLERSQKFVDAFATQFESIPADFVELSQTHPLRTKPVIQHEETYLCPAPMLLDWALQPLLEATVKGTSSWERYHRHRHDAVLHRTITLLHRMMPATSFESNLRYRIGDLPKGEYELDALGRFDSMVFLVEVKAQELTAPALRGAPDRLRRTLRDVIAESHEQAVRAKAFLNAARKQLGDEVAEFKRPDGSTVSFSMKGVRDIVLLSVTLAPLGHLTAKLHAGSPLELFQPEEFSWVVNIYDLMVIADILETPAAFPHYVTRRAHTARLGLLEASDELDIFGYYLKEGLYLDDVAVEMRAESEKAILRLLSYTGPFDDYYAYTAGIRETPAQKPTQRIPPDLRALLHRIDASGLSDRLTVSMALLDLDTAGRDALASFVERARKVSRRERRASNATIAGRGDGGWGISYWCDVRPEQVQGPLRSYCERKRAEERASKWYGVGESWDDDHRKVVSLVVLS